MNKKKINTIIAYATLSCIFSTNISSVVYAQNKVDVNSKANTTTVDTAITFKEASSDESLSENEQDKQITFTDKNFEAMIRKALKVIAVSTVVVLALLLTSTLF